MALGYFREWKIGHDFMEDVVFDGIYLYVGLCVLVDYDEVEM